MKHILLCALVCVTPVLGIDEERAASSLKSYLYNIGTIINNVEIPIVGKLENLLPCAVLSFCLQNFPGQAFVVSVASVTGYFAYKNDTVRNFLNSHNLIKKTSSQRKGTATYRSSVTLEDDFFVFDGDDDLWDEQEEEESEDELFDTFEESNKNNRKPIDTTSLSFL